MQLPVLMDYDDYRSYFRDLYRINKEKRRLFSYRLFARKVRWPVHYMHDVISGKRKLTLRRAVEFIRVAKLDAFETERLVFLVLADSDDANVAAFAGSQLKARSPRQGDDVGVLDEQNPFEKGLDFIAMRELYKWAGRLLPPAAIVRLLYSRHLSEAAVEALTRGLRDKGWISIDAEGRVEVTDEMIFRHRHSKNAEVAASDLEYVDNIARFLRDKRSPGLRFTAFTQLPLARIPEIHAKIVSLRNWILEIGLETGKNRGIPPKDRTMFQFSGFLFPLIDVAACPDEGRPSSKNPD